MISAVKKENVSPAGATPAASPGPQRWATRSQSSYGRPAMELLLTLTYVAICVAIFKIFRIPVNQWTLVTAALGGIFGLSLLFITMAYNHPFSTNARIYFTTVPILPSVKGRVIEVPVEDRTNQHLEAGEVLFKIDPKPYEYIV